MSEASEAILGLEPRPDPYVGKVLAGRYKIIRLIGSGGMGAVYEAEHTLIGRRVAVKLLYAQLASEAAVVKRFVNEARAAATIGHPNILECSDIGQADDGSPFLVLELLEGRDLEEEFVSTGPMPIGHFLKLIRQACDALAAAHDKGIIHRDIKPENIYLSTQKGVPNHVKVLDFGISKFNSLKTTGPGTMSGTAMGTPYYMSPEQFRDASNVDGRADIYAMGVILYQGFAGRLPYLADNLPSLALEIATGTPPPLESMRPDLPPELVAIVSKAMARNADDRFQTMRELETAIEPYLGIDAPVQAKALDLKAISHMDTAAAIQVSAAKSQIRVKADGEPTKSSPPWMAAGLGVLLIGGGAAGYAATRGPASASPAAAPVVATAQAPAAAAPAAAPAPAAEPPPVGAAPAAAVKHLISIESDASGATALLRGRTVTLPFREELESSSTPEIIDVSARGRTSLRYAIILDRPRTLFADLPHGRGQRVANEAEVAVALTGQPNAAASSGTSRSSASTSAAPAPTPSVMAAPPAGREGDRVYRGPSGDLPEL